MKRFLALLIASLLAFSTPVHAAQKKIAVKKVEQIASVDSADLLIANNSSIVLISNAERTTSDIALSALDATGKKVWEKILDSGLDEIAMAAARDSAGNLWIVGFSATPSTQ